MNKITLLGILELTAMVFKRVDEKQKLEYSSLEEGNSNYSYEIDSTGVYPDMNRGGNDTYYTTIKTVS